jgi:hypothetical protein
MAKGKTPLKQRLQSAFADLFHNKDTRVPDADYLPASIDKRSNKQVEKWQEQHRAIADFAIAHVGKQWFEAMHKTCRDEMCVALNIDTDRLSAGHDETYNYGNVVLRVKVDNGQNRLDKAALRTTLMVDYKFTADQAEACILKSTVKGKCPVHLTPSLVTE